MFTPKAAHVTNNMELEKHVEPQQQFEVRSVPLVIVAPVELVWELIGSSVLPDWCVRSHSPFIRSA